VARDKPAPTAAQEQLEQRDQEQTDTLAETASEQQSEQRDQLKQARKETLVSSTDLGEEPAAQHRSDHVQLYTRTSGNRPDQYTIRNPNEDALYGHFVVATGGEHEGLYGTYVDATAFKENGDPEIVTVRERGGGLRNFSVRYDDLAPAESRGNGGR
jgi:hypothetical protein